jgi:subtilisin family serine protease
LPAFAAGQEKGKGLRLITAAAVALSAFAASAGAASASSGEAETAAWPRGLAVVQYSSPQALAAALARAPAQVVRRVPALGVAEVRPHGGVGRFAALVSQLPGIVRVDSVVTRASAVEPALAPAPNGAVLQWQYAATHAQNVPDAILRAASAITVAVIDTGADLSAPDIAAKRPAAWSVRSGSATVDDANGHGTFVASLAAGSVTNGDGIAGAGGDAGLMVVQAGGTDGSFTDVQEAAAIVWAVDRGAKIINLSLGGRDTSTTERRAIEYAVAKGVLLVAAVGNSYASGNRVEYPAALLQPVGSRGAGGSGLAVGASTQAGTRASFSNTGTHVSLAAPGEGVLAAVSSTSSTERYPRVALPGSLAGLYGYGSGTSFAAPQVAGAAALVWGANPALTAQQVAAILEETASGHGTWTPELGFGVLDVAAAVARATGALPPGIRISGTREGRRVSLTWSAEQATSYQVTMAQDGGAQRVLTPATTQTSASYSLVPGSNYTFTVAALDATGSPLAVSEPFRVSLVRAATNVGLKASKQRGKAPLAVVLTATLRNANGPAGRTLVLESFDGAKWATSGSATTDASGRATWKYALKRGSYRVRARFAGDDDRLAATSAAVDLRAS